VPASKSGSNFRLTRCAPPPTSQTHAERHDDDDHDGDVHEPRQHPRETPRLVVAATHPGRRRQNDSVAGVIDAPQRLQVAYRWRLPTEVVAAQHVDVRARDRGDARYRGLATPAFAWS
jgi:hypothetical protein